MSSIAISLVTFVCLFGGALTGMLLRAKLPEHHLSDESKHILEVSMGIVGTMAGLVLGLLVGSATATYNAQRNELTEVSAKIILLDRVLSHYGPEADEPRGVLRATVNRTLNRLWPDESSRSSDLDPRGSGGELLYDKIEGLSPKNDSQRFVKSEALALGTDIGQTRWLMFEQLSNSTSTPLLVLLVFWFTVIFAGFGLFAPRNATVIGALMFCALSVSGAVLLMLEMYTPFQGMIHLSSAPLREALAQLGK